MAKKIFGLQRNVFFLGLTSLFNDMSSEMVLSAMPAFFISVLKSNAQALGIVEGTADAAANFIKIYSGRLSDKIQKRKIFTTIGYSLSVLTRPFYLLVGSVGGVIGIRVADRIGKGLRDAPRDVLISLSTTEKDVGKSFGYHRAMDTTGAIAGPLIAYAILRMAPDAFGTVFVAAFVAGLIALLSIFLVKDVVGIVSTRTKSSASFSSLPFGFKTYLASQFVLSVGSLPLAVLLFRTNSIGLVIASIPLFYAVYNISYAVLSLPGGILADRMGPAKVIVAGYIFLLIGYGALAVSQSAFLLVIGFLFVGIFSALTDGVQRSYVSQLVGEESRGLAYGFLNATIGFGSLIAGIAGGYLWQHTGDVNTLIIGGIAVVIGLMMFVVTRKK